MGSLGTGFIPAAQLKHHVPDMQASHMGFEQLEHEPEEDEPQPKQMGESFLTFLTGEGATKGVVTRQSAFRAETAPGRLDLDTSLIPQAETAPWGSTAGPALAKFVSVEVAAPRTLWPVAPPQPKQARRVVMSLLTLPTRALG